MTIQNFDNYDPYDDPYYIPIDFNREYARKKKLSVQRVDDLKRLYRGLNIILAHEDKFEPAFIVASLEYIEFQMQEAWGLPQDKSHHIYWDFMKKCPCKADKKRNRHYKKGCIYHGHLG